jgi:drug/metabolite transporter (DMT)-like permease
VAIAVFEGVGESNSPSGLVLCLLGTISNGLMMSLSGRVMSEKVDALRLTFYTAPAACLLLAPFHLRLEAKALRAYGGQAQGSYVGLLLLTCVCALAYNVSHYLMIHVTSSVTTTVLGEMKIILVLLLSAVLLGGWQMGAVDGRVGRCLLVVMDFGQTLPVLDHEIEPRTLSFLIVPFAGEGTLWTLQFLAGCTLAILGFCLYSHSRLRAAQLSAVPVIKGVPELAPLLRPGSAMGLVGLGSTGLRLGGGGDKGGGSDSFSRRGPGA